MPCAQCGDGTGNENINPLDTCSNGFMSCGNPCTTDPTNTAANETLPSQIENFTKQFFGEVIKTEINGVVSWSLPCSLEVGLPSNARGATEPLACYFLRLFANGVTGIPGAAGANGAAGAAGRNAYTYITTAFAQPTLDNPQMVFRTQYNLAIQPGMHIFVETSGWYRVEGVSPDGTVFVTFLQPITSPAANIEIGRLVLPAGAQGLSAPGAQGIPGAKGATGDKGPTGDTGATGLPGMPGPTSSVVGNNGQSYTAGGTDHTNPNNTTPTTVNFTGYTPTLSLTPAGVYLLNACVMLKTANSGTAFTVDLWDGAAVIPGASAFTKSTSPRSVSLTAIVTIAGPTSVTLQATGKNGIVYAEGTNLTFVQLA